MECPLILSDCFFFTIYYRLYSVDFAREKERRRDESELVDRFGDKTVKGIAKGSDSLIRNVVRDRVSTLCRYFSKVYINSVYNQCCIKGGRGRMVPTSVWSGGCSLFMVQMQLVIMLLSRILNVTVS